MTNIIIVAGSHKRSGASHRVTARLADLARATIAGSTAEILSLAQVPFWDEGKWGNPELADKWEAWHPISQKLRASDALIFVSPEYGGMVPPKLMNFLLLCSGDDIGHKPALAVGVSATRGGSYPITQLRSYGYKNNHICWLPDHLIIRNVNEQEEALPEASYELRYAIYCLKLLGAYAGALKSVRESGVVDHAEYPYGM